MNDELITRLVVGGPMSVQLGRPVGQRLEKNSKALVLRWNAGGWAGRSKQPALAEQSTFSMPLARLTRVAGGSGTRLAALVGAAGLLVAAGAAVGLQAHFTAPSTRPLPVANVAAREAPPVTVVSAPFVPEPAVAATVPPVPSLPIAAAPQAAAPGGELAPLPPALSPAAAGQRTISDKLAIAAAPTTTSMPTPARPAAAPPAPSAAVRQPAPKGQKEPEARPPSVLMDDPTPAAVAQRAQAARQPASAAQAQAQAQAKPADAPKPPRGTGLITITPDAKIAVFSNPKTRLPEQFKVGDTLPSGETLRSIDYKQGRVLTSSKEYSLD